MTQPKAHQGTDEITYQRPEIPSTVEVHEVPIVRATQESLGGYGKLVHDPENFTVENGSPTVDHVYVWYSDYHPDGGQMFYSRHSPFVANLAPALVAHATLSNPKISLRSTWRQAWACIFTPVSGTTQCM